MTNLLRELSKQEFDGIPKDKRIASKPVSVQIDRDKTKDIIQQCPLEDADAYVLVGKRERSFSGLFGERVFDDNFRADFDRIAEDYGYPPSHPARKYVQTHGYGVLSIYDVVYIKFLTEEK